MKNSFTRKQIGLAISCAFALGVVSATAGAETISTEVGYVVTQPDTAVRNSSGGCWRTGTGPPESQSECGAKAVAAPIVKVAEPVAMAPEPVAVAYVAPVRAAEHLTASADTLFDFDKSELRPAGRMKLDEFITKTKGIDPETITVVGHTDRFGSESYNQILSEQRANSVKNYLISKGIDPARIQTEGKGESQPVTLAGECSGAKSTKVIACLQPDRSVEIDVEGASIAYK